MENLNKRAWIYTRIDTPDESAAALQMQEQAPKCQAEELGLDIVGVSSDVCSGNDYDRPGLNSVLAAAENGGFDVLIITRLARNTVKIFELVGDFSNLGVRVSSAIEGDIDVDQSPFSMTFN